MKEVQKDMDSAQFTTENTQNRTFFRPKNYAWEVKPEVVEKPVISDERLLLESLTARMVEMEEEQESDE